MLIREKVWRPVPLFPAMGSVAEAALFWGIPGSPAFPRDEESWRRDLSVVVSHRLSGLALQGARDSRIELTEEIATPLRRAHRSETIASMQIEAAGRAVVSSLRDSGIECVITKGPGTARTYPSQSLRPFRDIDVLVNPDDFAHAMRLLENMGYVEVPGDFQPRRFFNRRCREGVNLVHPLGSIDLHHHVPPWIWGRRLSFREILNDATPIAVGGGEAPAASDVHNLLITALHVMSDKGRPGSSLIVWRDLASLAAHCDPDAVARAARDANVHWWLGKVARELPVYARPESIVEALDDAGAGPVDRFRLRRLLPPGLGSRHQIAQAFRLPVPNAIAFLAGYTFPSRQFLRGRYPDRGTFRQWWKDAGHRIHEAAHVQQETLVRR